MFVERTINLLLRLISISYDILLVVVVFVRVNTRIKVPLPFLVRQCIFHQEGYGVLGKEQIEAHSACWRISAPRGTWRSIDTFSWYEQKREPAVELTGIQASSPSGSEHSKWMRMVQTHLSISSKFLLKEIFQFRLVGCILNITKLLAHHRLVQHRNH